MIEGRRTVEFLYKTAERCWTVGAALQRSEELSYIASPTNERGYHRPGSSNASYSNLFARMIRTKSMASDKRCTKACGRVRNMVSYRASLLSWLAHTRLASAFYGKFPRTKDLRQFSEDDVDEQTLAARFHFHA
jgi:hypothetical protein